MGMKVGATLDKTQITYWKPKLSYNNWMRIFPNSVQGDTEKKFPPPWTDSRFTYCQQVGADPFISSKLYSDLTQLENLRQHIINMPAWISTLWITDHHEPESDITPAAYKSNFTTFWNECIQKLPAATRARVKAGCVLTNINTEDKFGGDYSVHDPIVGDFFGVDTYVRSYQGSPSQVITSFPANAATFLASIKNYNSGSRPKLFPELGAIGIPADTDGSARAAFLQRVHDEVKTWSNFTGYIWWNDDGTSGSALPGSPGIGSARYFQLDRRHTGGDLVSGSGDKNAYQTLANPLVLTKYNALATQENTSASGGTITIAPAAEKETAQALAVSGAAAPDPDPTPDPDPDPTTPQQPAPPVGGLEGSEDISPKLLASDYTILITDRNLNVVGDPIVDWTNIDVTLRFNEPSSGQVTMPAYLWVRQQLQPGNRVVCIRRTLGRGSVISAGPIESTRFEKSDDGDKSGDGVIVVSWADDLAWIGGRLSYPDPTKTPAQQTTDTWTWTGNAELGMRNLVYNQAGPGALAARKVPRLTLAPISSVGSNITFNNARFRACTDVLRDMALAGGELGFRTRQSWAGQSILFEVYRPQNLVGTVRFGFGLGNLKHIAYEQKMPEITTVIVGGQTTDAEDASGETANKFVTERADSISEATWGRIESLVGAPGNDPLDKLNAAADKELKERGQSTRLLVTAADTVDQRYGIHYDVGDRVSVEVYPGAEVADVVRLVHIQVFPTAGEVVTVTIGTQDARYETAWIKTLRAIDARVGVIERRI